jgi:hypothetical protein
MELERIVEVLKEVIRRLNEIEAKIDSPMNRIAHNRQESIERYRVAYNRQYGLPDGTIHPTNPDAEDELD